MFFSPLRFSSWPCVVLVLVFVLLGGLLTGRVAHAQDHIVERGWLEDSTGRLTWADVQQRPMQPFNVTLSRGYGAAVVWLRLRIDPQVSPVQANGASNLQDIVLRIRPVYLDDIQVFDPLAPGGYAGAVGDHHHPRHDVLPGTDFLLPIARGEAPRDIWLRLQSTSTRQIHVVAVARSELTTLMLQQSLLASFYIGVVLVLMIWGLVNYVLHRQSVMGAFALMQLTAFLFGLSASGILRVFWPLEWNAQTLSLLGSVFSVLVVVGALLFQIRFLREFQPARWAMGLLVGLLVLEGGNLVLLSLDQVIWALRSNMLIILLTPPFCLVCATTGRALVAADGVPAPVFTQRILVAFYAGFLVIFAFSATTALGLLPATEWSIYVGLVHALVSGVLLMLMLQYRSYVLGQQRQQALLWLESARVQASHERQMREDQEKLLAMLAHEIKNPLATMHLRLDGHAKGSREIRQAMREMDNVIERCLQMLQLGDGHLAPQMQIHDFTEGVRAAVSACSQPERVQVHLPTSLCMRTDPQLLFIVLSNLLENACKYSAPGTPIELQCMVLEPACETPAVRLELCNQPGQAGWPHPDCVFDKYYRSPQAQRQSGTGLGLYLVRSLTQALNGSIAYQPDDQWVRFVLTLPLDSND